MKHSKMIAAKRIAVAVAAVCATLSAPSYAADGKSLLDLMLKKGVITQAEYDDYLKSDAYENEQFKEKRIDNDVSNAVKFIQKNADNGSVMKNGIGMQSADGRNSIQLMGRLHMDYRAYSPTYNSAVTAPLDPTTDMLDIRRARLGVKGQFEKDWKYEIQGTYGMADNGMSESSTIVDIAFMDYAANPAMSFRFGKFKMPFSLEQLTSSNNIDFMERSIANQNEGEYVPAKETGVMVYGSPVAGTSYGLALSRGRANKGATVDGNDLVARATANIAKVYGGRDDLVTHLGFGWSKGAITTTSSTATTISQSARDESRAFNNFFVASSASSNLVLNGSDRSRSDIEYAFAYGPFKAQGEYFNIGYTTTDRVERAVKINYNEVMWNITGESHNYSNSAGTFGTIKPNKKFTETGGLGAWQVGARYTQFDATDFIAASGKTNKANAWTLGLNWYVNDNVRFMLNYVETRFDTTVGSGASRVDKDQAVMLRSQVNF